MREITRTRTTGEVIHIGLALKALKLAFWDLRVVLSIHGSQSLGFQVFPSTRQMPLFLVERIRCAA